MHEHGVGVSLRTAAPGVRAERPEPRPPPGCDLAPEASSLKESDDCGYEPTCNPRARSPAASQTATTAACANSPASKQKLVQLYYKRGVSEEVLKAEQERIEAERAQAQQWAEAADRAVEDVMAALDDALLLLDETKIIYEALPNDVRRLVNQAVFLALTVRDPDTIDAQRTPFFEALHRLAQALQEANKTLQVGQNRPRAPQDQAGCPQDDATPIFGAGFVHRSYGGSDGGLSQTLPPEDSSDIEIWAEPPQAAGCDRLSPPTAADRSGQCRRLDGGRGLYVG
jgi:hypothetical protein